MNDRSKSWSAASPSRNIRAIAATAFFTMLAGGCADSYSGRRAESVVVDVISVARALGRDEIIQQKLEDANAVLNDQLAQISTSLQQRIKEEQSRLKQSKSPSDQEKIDQLAVQSQLKLRRSQLAAKQKADEFRSRLLLEFRAEVLKVARDIAKDRRALSIQLANDDLLWYDSSIDITADVIKALRASDHDKARSGPDPAQKADAQSNATAEDRSPKDSEQVNQLNRLMDSLGKKADPNTPDRTNESAR